MDQQQGQLSCLLADFNALKSEIARRSDLQRIVVLAYVGVLALVFRERATSIPSVVWVPVIWISDCLAVLYYEREQLEIERLAGVIKASVAVNAKVLCAATTNLFASETDPESTGTLKKRFRYQCEFDMILFVVAPALLTALFLLERFSRLGSIVAFETRYPWYAIVSVLAAGRLCVILRLWSRVRVFWHRV